MLRRLVLAACTLLLAAAALLQVHSTPSRSQAPEPAGLMGFWDKQKKGANFFNRVPAKERFQAAGELGLQFIRLVPDKWQSSTNRDFLLGSADHYQGLPEADLARLKEALDWAATTRNKVVLGMLSLPGARWVQLNQGQQDYRLWNSEDFQAQACRFWRDLAGRLKGHPAIVAYNPLNEPHPEREAGIDGAEEPEFADWWKKRRGTLGDLDLFYGRICAAIREVDAETPILVEGYGHGSATGLSYLSPVEEAHILYSFHFYEPWNYTATRVNKGRYAYPDRMPQSWDGPTEEWNRADLWKRMEPVEEWAGRVGIPRSRIVAAEFGCGRKSEGVIRYLSDLIALLNEKGYHWAFYSYREDTWDEMDYELGTDLDGGGGHNLLEQGRYRVKRWRDNPLFDVFKREFRP